MEANRLDRTKYIGRTDIISKLGITRDKLYYALKHFAINMPKPKEAKRNGSGFKYNEAEIDAWVATDPLKDVTYIDPEKIAAKERAKNIGIDNSAAMHFISGKFDPLESRLEYMKKLDAALNSERKTVALRTKEHDDYTPPRSGMASFRRADSYRVAHEGGNLL